MYFPQGYLPQGPYSAGPPPQGYAPQGAPYSATGPSYLGGGPYPNVYANTSVVTSNVPRNLPSGFAGPQSAPIARNRSASSGGLLPRQGNLNAVSPTATSFTAENQALDSSVTSTGISPKRQVLDDDDEETKALSAICSAMDTDHSGDVSKLEFITAVCRDPKLARRLFPHCHSFNAIKIEQDGLKLDEVTFDTIDTTFDTMATGRQRIPIRTLVRELRTAHDDSKTNSIELRNIFDRIDTAKNGVVSKLEFISALSTHKDIGEFVLPGVDCTQVLKDEDAFNAAECVFQTIACGMRCFGFSRFEAHYKKFRTHLQTCAQKHSSEIRVLVIGPGYGARSNPGQLAMIENAGFQVKVLFELPNPETPGFPVHQELPKIQQAVQEFAPDVVTAASKGGVYLVRLWQTGIWRGPTVMINMNPQCQQLPDDVPIAISHGSNDETYPADRLKCRQILSTGGKNLTFLNYVGSSGILPNTRGGRTRNGDSHNMASLQTYDCLPRLIDGVASPLGPELWMIKTNRFHLSEERLRQEEFLGYTPNAIRRHWSSRNASGLDENKLFPLAPNSEEFFAVSTVFKVAPASPAYYPPNPQERQVKSQASWESKQIMSIHRIENGLQVDACAEPYFNSLRRSLEVQGVDFAPGEHTVWAFHGADPSAIKSIIEDPMQGVQPLASGSRASTLWGKGTYLARDAKYVGENGFAGQPDADGTLMILMCLTMTGIYCEGDPDQIGLLPFRQPGNRYHSTVDFLAAPEIYIVQQSGAVFPAYLIRFLA